MKCFFSSWAMLFSSFRKRSYSLFVNQSTKGFCLPSSRHWIPTVQAPCVPAGSARTTIPAVPAGMPLNSTSVRIRRPSSATASCQPKCFCGESAISAFQLSSCSGDLCFDTGGKTPLQLGDGFADGQGGVINRVVFVLAFPLQPRLHGGGVLAMLEPVEGLGPVSLGLADPARTLL